MFPLFSIVGSFVAIVTFLGFMFMGYHWGLSDGRRIGIAEQIAKQAKRDLEKEQAKSRYALAE